MPSAAAAALYLALALAVLLVQPPGAAAVRRRGEDDDRYDNEEASDDDDDDDAVTSDATASAAAVAPPPPPLPTAKRASAPVKAPSALLSKAHGGARAPSQDDDSDDDSEDDAELARLKAEEKAQQGELVKVETALDVNLVKQTQAKAKLADMNDPRAEGASDTEIEVAVKAINNETQSEALGTVLGKMWKEMRMYAGPFYGEHLEKELKKLDAEEASLNAKEKHLRATLKSTRSNLDKELDGSHAKEEKDDEEEKDTKEEKEADVKVEAPAAAAAANKKNADKEKTLAGREKTRMWLAMWFAGVIALVVITFIVARRQQ